MATLAPSGVGSFQPWQLQDTEDSAHDSPQTYTCVETDPGNRYSRYDEILGRGAFKSVYKAFDESEGLEVAWNQVKVNDLVSSPAERERLFAEIRVLKQLKHKNIMSFYDSWLDQKNMTVNFITELFTSGTLRQYRKKHKHIDEQVLKRWAWQILQGLVYLHGHNPPIIHRDLKCDNIFVNGASGVIKIGDLGLATLWRGLTTPQSVLGTPEFMAPELYEEKYNEKVDVYSFGMCMLELATMEYPYSECKNAAQIYKKVTSGVQPAGLSKVAHPELREFIQVCINQDPEARPEARQLLKSSFFESIRNGKLSCPGVDKGIVERNTEEEGRSPPLSASDGSAGQSEDDDQPPMLKLVTTNSTGTASGLPPTGANGSSSTRMSGFAPERGPTPPPTPAGMAFNSGSRPSSPLPPAWLSSASASQNGNYNSYPQGGMEFSKSSGQLLELLANGGANGVALDRSMSAAAFGNGHAAYATSPPSQSPTAGSVEGRAPPPWESTGIQGQPSVQPSMSSCRGGGQSEHMPGSPDSERGREFYVSCKHLDQSKFSFQLKFVEPEGTAKTIEFAFDSSEDTAECIANEMMEDLSLSAHEAQIIAAQISSELERSRAVAAGLSSGSPSRSPSNDLMQPWSAAHANVALHTQESAPPAVVAPHARMAVGSVTVGQALSSSATAPTPLEIAPPTPAATGRLPDPSQGHLAHPDPPALYPSISVPVPPRPTAAAPPAGPPLTTVSSSATAASPLLSTAVSSNGPDRMSHDRSSRPSVVIPASMQLPMASSGNMTPPLAEGMSSGRQLSIHALIAAMKEVHEEERKAPQAAVTPTLLSTSPSLRGPSGSASALSADDDLFAEVLRGRTLGGSNLDTQSQLLQNGYKI